MLPFSKVNISLYNQLSEIKNDSRYKVKVRIRCSGSEASLIDKNLLIEAGANKVEIVTEDIEETEVAKSSLFEKFDNKQIKKRPMRTFVKKKEIADPSLGLSYLSKID